MSSSAVGAEFPAPGAPPPPRTSRIRSIWLPLSFVGPALVLLTVWMIYPAIRTVVRSFFDNNGKHVVWFQNYHAMFADPIIHTAIKNNVIWIAVAPAAVTLFGLVLAVLTEKIAWASFFKIVLFMPLAVSLFAVGVIWRIMYQQNPDAGAINAGLNAIHNVFSQPGVLPRAQPSSPDVNARFVYVKTLSPGGTAKLGLTAISPQDVPKGAQQAAQPQQKSGAITGVVWRDFRPGGGKAGVVEQGELGIPGVTVNLLQNGKKAGTAKTDSHGAFTFDGLSGSGYQVGIASSTFAKPWSGVQWLGPKLITPSMIIAFLWTAVGFAMVVIGAGLSAIPRDVLEAARTDGATEFQVFRRVTVPLLMPVLTVVFVTQMIGVLKIFDIIYATAPGSVTNDATTLAYEMWKRSFLTNAFGIGSAIATFLMVLFIPFLIYQVRSQRKAN
jgi:alpha-glucoside transport system permease protein